jgi:serine protease AprX
MRVEQSIQAQSPLSAAPAAAPAPAAGDPSLHVLHRGEDTFQYSDRDLTPEGTLPIIIFSEQEKDLDKTRSRIDRSDQSHIYTDLPLVNGFSANVSPSDLGRIIDALPEGVGVRINRKIQFADPEALSKMAGDTTPPSTPGSPVPTPELDPSRATIGIQNVWNKGFTGKGVGIAIIDSGIYPHPDLKDRITGWVDIADGKPSPYDNFGHGTHVAGDAAGNGSVSQGIYKGVAPDADLIGVRITTVAEAIKGIQWCIENKQRYNIKVINMSLGDFATKSAKDDPWSQACEKAIQAGLVVCVAAGNEGPDPGSIDTPAINPHVITVGALDDKHTADHGDDTIASFSSRGPTSTDNISKPDVIAPGVSVFGPLSPGATLDVPELPHVGKNYIAISGTSMATPMVAGLCADLLQANPSLTHDDIKKILMSTADKYLPDDANAQGAGLIDPTKALDMALAMKNGAAAPSVEVAKAPAPAAASSPEASQPHGSSLPPSTPPLAFARPSFGEWHTAALSPPRERKGV